MNTYVIILNWKGWQDTIKCIDSLKMLAQRPHIVVVDNASGDESTVRIRTAHPDVHLIESSQNLGFAGGNNLGIRYALEHGAKYVWLLNNDTIVQPDSLSALLQVSQQHNDDGLIASSLWNSTSPHRLQTYGGGKVNTWLGRTRFILNPVEQPDYLVFASVLIPTQVFQTCGLLNDHFFLYWEDVEYSTRAKKAGFALRTAHNSVVFHKESASLGKKNPLLDSYTSESLIKFFSIYVSIPWLPISCALVTKTISRIYKGHWKNIWAVWKPVFQKNWRTHDPL
ncbi:MAG: glycosyltransferase family 2 protein [Deinococcaceae bacterium]